MNSTKQNNIKSENPNIYCSEFGIKVTVIICIALATVSSVFAQTPYYIKTKSGLAKVEHSDPSKIKVREWQVRLYKNGAPTGGEDYWGIIRANTSDEVMQKLKSNQEFELRYNSWAGKGRVRDEVLTNFNPLGPIAVLDESENNSALSNNDARQEALDNLTNKYDEVQELYEGYQSIEEILAKNPKIQTPFDGFGDVFKEYADNLKDAFQRVNDLKYKLEHVNNLNFDQINSSLKEIDSNLQVARYNSNYINQKLKIEGDKNSSHHQAGSNATSNDLDRFSEELMNSFGGINSQDPDALLQQINRLTKTMAESLDENGNSDERLVQLSQLLKAMSESDDLEVMSSYLQRVIVLIIEISENP